MRTYGNLSRFFSGIGFKRLQPVEIYPAVSNAHEFNGVANFKALLGTERLEIPVRFLYLCDEEEKCVEEENLFTWYDARENHPTRSEYRLYYKSSTVISERAREGDLLIIALNNAASNVTKTLPTLIAIVAKQGDNIERQLAWLFAFELDDASTQKIQVTDGKGNDVNYFTSFILEKLGINIVDDDRLCLEQLLQEFPNGFPGTREFSQYARSLVPDIDPREDADFAIINWIEIEEKAFKLLEHHLVSKRIEEGIISVDDFLSYSLSVQNRRKSRAGHALENHLCHLFDCLNLQYAQNPLTENNVRPDFIFPSIQAYENGNFTISLLDVLGVKTTYKDRWRQVLSEAQRIPEKHLLTLEPGISENQTSEMKANRLQLVVPRDIFSSYSDSQQKWLMNISEFVNYIKRKQS